MVWLYNEIFDLTQRSNCQSQCIFIFVFFFCKLKWVVSIDYSLLIDRTKTLATNALKKAKESNPPKKRKTGDLSKKRWQED